MNTWKKIDDAWCVACPQPQKPGDKVVVSNKAGTSKTVTLGEPAGIVRYPSVTLNLFKVATPAPAAAVNVNVGSLDGILAVFKKAQGKLKFPAIVLAYRSGEKIDMIRLSIAGPNARAPGSVTVTDGEKTIDNGDGTTSRSWFGRILLDGTYQPSRDAGDRTQAIVENLREFAADPAAGAMKSAKLTGRCCFCNTGLGDARSTAMGYGPICAKNYGLPWGEEKFSFKAEEVTPVTPTPTTPPWEG